MPAQPAPPSSRSLLPRCARSTSLAAAASCMGGEENGALATLSPLENIGLGVAAGALGQRVAAGHTSWLCSLFSVPELVSAPFAGTVEVCLLQPMLYCKNAVQQARPFTLDPRLLYRGLLMSVTNMSVLTGAQVCAWPASTVVALAIAPALALALTSSRSPPPCRKRSLSARVAS